MDAARHAQIDDALRSWVRVRQQQWAASRALGNPQQGSRAAVTAGAHLRDVDLLIADLVGTAYGTTNVQLYRNRAATVAGYYRATKSWDLLVTLHDNPVLLVEYKSMSGSEGKNLNNRADEMFGMAEDARAAERHGILPPDLVRAFVFVMGANRESLRPVGTGSTLWGIPDPAFQGASYLNRMAIMLERMRDQDLYHLAWAVGVHEDPFSWFEPRPTVGWDRFEQDLHACAVL